VLGGFRHDLDRLMPAWDLAVISSYTEGLPNVALEALAAGVPVVATEVGGVPEIVRDGLNGFLVPPGNPTELARAILRALQSEAERRALGEAGRQDILNNFGFAARAGEYERLRQEVTRATGRAPMGV
jgi:glycosyltransferase involved in cell wall biosynthesis